MSEETLAIGINFYASGIAVSGAESRLTSEKLATSYRQHCEVSESRIHCYRKSRKILMPILLSFQRQDIEARHEGPREIKGLEIAAALHQR